VLFHFLSDDTPVAVNVRRDGGDWLLEIDGQEVPLQAELDRTGVWLVDTHQGRRRLWVAGRGDERFVFCNGKVHRFRLIDPDQDAADDAAGGPDLVADMPGKVVQVLVAAGDRVQVGQPLLIMESMKMETELLAHLEGKVDRVAVEAGQVIAQGELLVSIEPVSDDSAAGD
jgi:3-methylcrotonyl-CoA carboxylase alpha subunit